MAISRVVATLLGLMALVCVTCALGPADFERFNGVMNELRKDRYPYHGSDSHEAHQQLCERARSFRRACRDAANRGAFSDDADVLTGLDNILLGALGGEGEDLEPASDTGSDTADQAESKTNDVLAHSMMNQLLQTSSSLSPDTHISHPDPHVQHGLNQAHINQVFAMLGNTVEANMLEMKAQLHRGLQEMDDLQDWDDADPEGRGGGGYLGAGGLNSGMDWNNPAESDQTELQPLLAGGF